jgi:hypothetical protein
MTIPYTLPLGRHIETEIRQSLPRRRRCGGPVKNTANQDGEEGEDADEVEIHRDDQRMEERRRVDRVMAGSQCACARCDGETEYQHRGREWTAVVDRVGFTRRPGSRVPRSCGLLASPHIRRMMTMHPSSSCRYSGRAMHSRAIVSDRHAAWPRPIVVSPLHLRRTCVFAPGPRLSLRPYGVVVPVSVPGEGVAVRVESTRQLLGRDVAANPTRMTGKQTRGRPD